MTEARARPPTPAAGIHVGTSGWHYRHWVGPFYPPGLAADGFLDFYARRLRTVEINNTFYALPPAETLAAWRAATPDGFVFACKASRYITHMKKLQDPAAATERFFAALAPLGRKLGPVLFQLPPRWGVNASRLARFLEALPEGVRYAFEFRDESWFTAEVYRVLARHNAALCFYDYGGRRSPLTSTADFVYLRLHGPARAYGGRYDGRTLSAWAGRIDAWHAAGSRVYCYFDNDEAGYAPGDAERLLAMISRRRARRLT